MPRATQGLDNSAAGMTSAEPWKPDSVSHLWGYMEIFLAGTGKSHQGQTRDGDGDNCPRALDAKLETQT